MVPSSKGSISTLKHSVFAERLRHWKHNLNQPIAPAVFKVFSEIGFSYKGGFILRRGYDRRYGVIVGLVSCLTSMVALSRVRTLVAFMAAMVTVGISSSALFMLIISWTFEAFPDNGNAYMQLVAFITSIGYTLAPMIAKPYLLDDSRLNLTESQRREYYLSNSNINVPLDICAAVSGFVLTMVIFELVVSLLQDQKILVREHENKERISTSSTLPSRNYMILIVILGSVMACCCETFSKNTANYLMTYLTNIGLTKASAADMVSLYGIALAVGRLLGVVVATKIREGTMLTYCLVLSLTGNIIIMLASNRELMITVGIVVLSLGKASMSGSVYAVIDRRVKMTNFISGIIHFAATFGPIVYPFISGPIIDEMPSVVLYINISFLVVFMASFACICATDKRSMPSEIVTEAEN
ncbi:hypothetical protein HDE_04491 [Halotydeus destructor]|nr:hypothetical protein HDE_04491 [Halotydeus destructor]